MSSSRALAASALLPLLLSSCWGRGFEYEGGVPLDTAAPPASTCGEDLDLTTGINVSGVAIDLETGAPLVRADTAVPALCVAAIDPSPVVGGLPPVYLLTSTLCDDGSFVLAGLESIPAIGLFVGVYDCEDEGTVMRTVTGIAPEEFDGMGAGDTLADRVAISVSTPYLAKMQADLPVSPADTDQDTGTRGPDLATDGFLAGFVLDAAGEPVGGAQVGCGACASPPTQYLDPDPADGLWGAAATSNTATSAEAGAMFIVPAAQIITYTCDDGGAHTWEGKLFGSLPGYAAFIEFEAQ
jgi:hypothetical protein